MVSYFTLVASSKLGYATLYAVTEPKKKSNGKWGVSKTSVPTVLPQGSYGKLPPMFSSLGAMVKPVTDKKPTTRDSVVNNYRKNESYIITIKNLSDKEFRTLVNSYIGTSVSDTIKFSASNIKSFMSSFDPRDVNCLDAGAKDLFGALGVMKHKKGQWKITRNSTNKLVDIWGWGRDKTTTESFEVTNDSKDKDFQTLLMGMLVFSPPLGCKNNVTNNYTITLKFTYETLAEKNNWELGAIAGTGNEWGDNYCFYCSDVGLLGNVDHFCSSLPCYLRANASKLHKKSTHKGGSTGTDVVISGGTDNSAYKSITYDPSKIYKSKTWSTIGTAVKHLEYGTKGTYTDGVATIPYVIIELRGNDSKTSPAFNMSIPANTFVSLSHERNLGDGYNTFSLQLFDKDAMVVEDKLILGFRYITFYYTDFVSTSKRFKGEILDYKTVITGKGLMLTITGYSSSSTIYTGKESIPWSTICEARDWAFYYWYNDAKEYHGPVYLTNGDYYTGKTEGDKHNGPIYNSTEGTILGATYVEQSGEVSASDLNSIQYCLKAPLQIPDKGSKTGYKQSTEFCTFDYYYENTDKETKDKYRPHPEKWSLEYYNSNIANELAAWSLGDITEKRPHNIVIMICAINKWLWKPEYITKTRKVSEIPDMVSMSFVEYIKESLIPISIATGKNGSSQFYFWFDEEGYAHFGPKNTKGATKSLYFNAKEVEDSYPLIAFTAASNGSVLMQTDGSQSLSSVNIFTGDELDVSSVELDQGDDYLDSVHQSAEWFVTNTFTQKEAKSNLVSYSGTTVIASEDDLKKQLAYKYGLVSKYSYTASLDVYGCSDIEPGQMVNIYIYLGDGVRTKDSVSKKDENSDTGYIGNVTMHHSSGTYFVNKIKDNISGGKYISTLEVLKVDFESLESIMGSSENETLKIESTPSGESTSNGECVNFNSYTAFKNLNK